MARHVSSKPLNPKAPLQSLPAPELCSLCSLHCFYASLVTSARIYEFKVIIELSTKTHIIFTFFYIYIYIQEGGTLCIIVFSIKVLSSVLFVAHCSPSMLGGDLATMLASIGLYNF